MADTSALELFAEISIGLIGFAGVVTALGRSRLPLPTRSFRIWALLLYSIVALGGSLFPIVLSNYGLNASSVWLTSSIVLVTAQLTMLAWAAKTIPPLVRDGHLPTALAGVVFALYMLVALYLVYGILFARASLSAIYLVGIFFGLCLGVFHFFHLVISVPMGDRDDDT